MKVWIEAVGFDALIRFGWTKTEVWDEVSSNWGQFLAKQSVVFFWITLPETTIAPENGWLEDYFPFRKSHFQRICSFQGGYCLLSRGESDHSDCLA